MLDKEPRSGLGAPFSWAVWNVHVLYVHTSRRSRVRLGPRKMPGSKCQGQAEAVTLCDPQLQLGSRVRSGTVLYSYYCERTVRYVHPIVACDFSHRVIYARRLLTSQTDPARAGEKINKENEQTASKPDPVDAC